MEVLTFEITITGGCMPGGLKTERDEIWRYVWRGDPEERHTDVKGGAEMLVALCADMKRHDAEKFKRLPDEFPSSTRKHRFARSASGQNEPKEIPGTGVFLDVNMNTKAKKAFAKKLVRHFGFPEACLEIESCVRKVR